MNIIYNIITSNPDLLFPLTGLNQQFIYIITQEHPQNGFGLRFIILPYYFCSNMLGEVQILNSDMLLKLIPHNI